MLNFEKKIKNICTIYCTIKIKLYICIRVKEVIYTANFKTEIEPIQMRENYHENFNQ